MQEIISEKRFKDKYLLKISPFIESDQIEEFKSYLKGGNKNNQKTITKISLDFLYWILKNNKLSEEYHNVVLDEIKYINSKNEEIKSKFYGLKSRNNIAGLLNIKLQRLTYLLYVQSEYKKYTEFEIRKRKGGVRTILAPVTQLKYLQKSLNSFLQICYENKISAHGFIKGKSIITNAEKHIKKKNILNVDIKDFFPSINFGRVRGLFLNAPFNFSNAVASMLAQICCVHNQLPQGSPSSPIISNMICRRLDTKLMKLAQRYYCTYTRYADDITFSNNKYRLPENLSDEISKIIREEGFEVNEAKIRNQTRIRRQEVTGLTVNEKVNINRKYIRKVRAILHSWETEGYENAAKKYFNKYDRHRLNIPNLSNSIAGKIEFIGSIRGKQDSIYIKLSNRYKIVSGEPIVEQIADKYEERKIKREKILQESKYKLKIKRENYDKKLLHDPKALVKSLQSFSNPQYSIRNLVHKPLQSEDFNLDLILTKSREEYMSMKSSLPSFVRSNIEKGLFKRICKKRNQDMESE